MVTCRAMTIGERVAPRAMQRRDAIAAVRGRKHLPGEALGTIAFWTIAWEVPLVRDPYAYTGSAPGRRASRVTRIGERWRAPADVRGALAGPRVQR